MKILARFCVRFIVALLFVARPVYSLAQNQTATPAPQAKDPAKEKEEFLSNYSVSESAALDPNKRGTLRVEPGERSPFGVATEETAEAFVAPESESEEMKLRRILINMRVSGCSGSSGGYRVLLGNVLLSPGDIVPQMFAGQSEVLRVEEVSDRSLVLAFEEKDKSRPPRSKLQLAVDLRPKVRSILPGDLFTKVVPFDKKGQPDLKPLETAEVAAVVKETEVSNMQSLVERSAELLGEDRLKPRTDAETPSQNPNPAK